MIHIPAERFPSLDGSGSPIIAIDHLITYGCAPVPQRGRKPRRKRKFSNE